MSFHAARIVILFNELVNINIMPYYLHQMDKIKGGEHFYLSEDRGKAIMEKIRRQLSGFAIPRYVREEAMAPYKIPLI